MLPSYPKNVVSNPIIQKTFMLILVYDMQEEIDT